MKESKIEKAANLILKNEGWICEKVKFGNSGYPDRFYIHVSGVTVWIEYKKSNHKTGPDPLQVVRLRMLRERHQFAVWADNANDAVWYCRACLVAKGVPSGRYQNVSSTGRGSFVLGPWTWKDKPLPSSGEDPQSSYVNQ